MRNFRIKNIIALAGALLVLAGGVGIVKKLPMSAGAWDARPVITTTPATKKTNRIKAAKPTIQVRQNEPEVLHLVTKVVDGDTIEIDTGERVRYIGMDTPETVHPKKPVQCFGKEASAKNKELVAGKEVKLVKDVSDVDRYGRLLRYVYVGDQFINLELVKHGYARAATFPPDVAHADDFVAAEREARAGGVGLWSACE